MDIVLDSMAWLPKDQLSTKQVERLRSELMLQPRQVSEYKKDLKPIYLYLETTDKIGVARDYFIARKRDVHNVIDRTVLGGTAVGIGGFSGTLREEQAQAVEVLVSKLDERYGGVFCARGGFGKTVVACAVMAALNVPTIVIVHKTFLLEQWRERIAQFLPDARVGIARQNDLVYEGCSIVLGMIHSVVKDRYPEAFYNRFGLVIHDELHRLGAYTFSNSPKLFKARYRLGLTATPRRNDQADNVFWYHIGPILFAAKSQGLKPSIKRVYTEFSLISTDRFNPNLASRNLIIRFLCANKARNRAIVKLMIEAVSKDRKLLVLSERLKHLRVIQEMFEQEWPLELGSIPSMGYYVGGMQKKELKVSEQAAIILATKQYVSEGFDVPALDTLFLTTPVGDVEQTVYRIVRKLEGKKKPIVVDFRDDAVPRLRRSGINRDAAYARLGYV
jgi:superfamily II DNA or RNA helicase